LQTLDNTIPADLLSIWGSVASISAILLSVLYWLAKVMIRSYQARALKSGIYRGFWIDPLKPEVNCEVLRLSSFFGSLRAHPVYVHKKRHDYTLFIEPAYKSKDIYLGRWVNSRKSSLYHGTAMFRFDDQQLDLEGRWLGPRKEDHSINGGVWHLVRYASEANNKYIHPPLWLRFDKLLSRLIPESSIIHNIIHKHEKYGIASMTFDNIKLKIERGTFVPSLGKVSISLVQRAALLVHTGDTVLDLGTGSGFYAIYLAKKFGIKCIGVDSSSELLDLARTNAEENGVEKLTEFKKCDPKDLFSAFSEDEKFNLIIANLPFSRRSLTAKSKSSQLYSSFAGSPRLVVQLILGSQFHALRGAQLLFCYGESGYREYLQDVIQVSAWESQCEQMGTRGDDTFYFYKLKLSPFVESAYSHLQQIFYNKS
jgi:SAM-dependent methyltransferase